MRRRAALILTWAVLLLTGRPVLAQPALWTVRGPHATVVLFGSVHLLPPGLDWRPPALTQALASAKEIWFELPIDAATAIAAQKLAMDKGLLAKGGDLFGTLSPADADRLRAACAQVAVPPALLATMRPWLAEVTLSLAQDAQAGGAAGQGVDQQISDHVAVSVPRRAFETARQQIDFLAAAPMAEQLASLDETITEIANDPTLFQRVVNAWLSGDVVALRKDALEPLIKSSPGMYRRLITDRNRHWASVLARRLKGGNGVIVVVVGTAHLIGPDGVPALLRARGFNVDGPGLESGAAPRSTTASAH
ncbi:MAG TPA: TraB/GumN family protein [Caulobacteraceae bacterium]|jgi:hypothetical protein